MTLEEFTSQIDSIVNEVAEERRVDMQAIGASLIQDYNERLNDITETTKIVSTIKEEKETAIEERNAAEGRYKEATAKYYEVLRTYGGGIKEPEKNPEYKTTSFEEAFK